MRKPIIDFIDDEYSAERLIAELWIVGSWQEAVIRFFEWESSGKSAARRKVLRMIKKYIDDDAEWLMFEKAIGPEEGRGSGH